MKWHIEPDWSEASIAANGGRLPDSLYAVLSRMPGRMVATMVSNRDRIRMIFGDKWGYLSRRAAGPAPCWAWRDTIRVRAGEWMRPYGQLDLSGPYGMAQLVHEMVHVLQYIERGTLATAWNLWLPWATGRQHSDIAWEQEASEVQRAFAKWAVA